MIKNILAALFLVTVVSFQMIGQDVAVINGNFETNVNVFLRDSSINAVAQPQYKNEFYGGEAWLNLSYAIKGFKAGIRYDMFNNSNLADPNGSYTGQGIGRWFVSKEFKDFSIQVGNIYDQIGSGIIFRSYETRPLFIDNSVLGAMINYKFTENLKLKGFVGQQKNAFDLWGGSLKGLSLESFYKLGNGMNQITVAPGVGFINKTLSNEAIDKVVSSLKTYLDEDRFKPTYNNYAFTAFNSLGFKGFNWYIEAAYKSDDIFFDPQASVAVLSGPEVFGKLVRTDGSVLYSSLSYAKNKLALTVEGKRTENFVFRMDPSARLLRGLISYIPPMTRVNTYRLTARYSPATQEISEKAFQIDARYRFNKKINANVNYSNISTLEGTRLYEEIFTEVNYKFNRNTKLKGGVQLQTYNQEVYEVKPEVPLVTTITPYFDLLHKFNRKQSLRVEGQYMATDQDFGSWVFGLAEFGIAPNWIFEVSAMYNLDPKKSLSSGGEPEKILYPTLGAVYVKGANRFQLKYVKQVEGIVCSGGICRLEPAFSGVRFSFSSNF